MLPEIHASGFRNPYRFSFDLATGDLYVADVGQNNIEQLDRVTAGFGFRASYAVLRISPLPTSALTSPPA